VYFVMGIGEEVVDVDNVFLEGDVLLETVGKLFGGANGFFLCFLQICF